MKPEPVNQTPEPRTRPAGTPPAAGRTGKSPAWLRPDRAETDGFEPWQVAMGYHGAAVPMIPYPPDHEPPDEPAPWLIEAEHVGHGWWSIDELRSGEQISGGWGQIPTERWHTVAHCCGQDIEDDFEILPGDDVWVECPECGRAATFEHADLIAADEAGPQEAF